MCDTAIATTNHKMLFTWKNRQMLIKGLRINALAPAHPRRERRLKYNLS